MLTSRCNVADFALADIASASSVLDAAETLARIYDFAKHPYFVWANAPTTKLEEFRASQAPYLQYVEQFSRSLAIVLGRTSSMHHRLTTVFDNVSEEHGHGKFDGSHRNTYEGYLRAIGVRDEAIHAPCPPRFYVASQSLLDFCLANTVEMGAAAVGMVEYTHIKIARLLAEMIHRRFWGDLDAQRHYRLHAEIDAEHALSLFALCHDGWKESRSRENIAFAMAFSVQVWWAQFEALIPAQKLEASPSDGIRQLLDAGAAKEAVGELDLSRVKCDLPVRVRNLGESWQAVRATSIGESGVAVQGLPALPVDAEVEVMLGEPLAAPLVLQGRVRSKPREDGELCVEFIMDDARSAELKETIRTHFLLKKPEQSTRSNGAHNGSSSNGFAKLEIGTCDHVGIRVTDAERARSFYALFGFRLDADDTWEEHRALGLVNDAGLRLNLIYNAVPRGAQANVLMDEPQKWAGYTHLALSVKSLDDVVQFLAHHEIPITEGPLMLGNQRRICFVRDPDNNVIEFTERWSQYQPPELGASR